MASSSETELFASETYPSEDLQNLFEQLAKHTNKKQEIDGDNFETIRSSIDKLPKITSNLESQLETIPKKQNILRINDPITTVRTKSEKEKDQDAGSNWFNMKQPELTGETKRDLLIIKQRSALDPKRHYKKQKWDIPKYFQMGTIVEGNTEFYSKMKRKQRGNNLVEEILHDGESSKYFKRKYSQIQESKMSGKKGHYKKVKDMRKRF